MPELRIDREIAAIVPDPEPVLPGDDATINTGGVHLERGLDRRESWLSALRDSIAASRKPQVQVIVWQGKGVIIDGIQRYRVCKAMGIKPQVIEIELPDKAEAIRERWRRNVSTLRNLSDFARAEQVYRYWDKYFRPERTAAAKQNKGGRGKRTDRHVDQLGERAKLAGLSRPQMYKAEQIIKYADNAERRMPQELLDHKLRRLRNNTIPIGSVYGTIKGFDARAARQEKKSMGLKAVDWSGRTGENGKLHPARTAWTGETNVVINGDCLDILGQIAPGAVDRFAFSPPYYLADKESPDDVIHYGGGFKPFRSWDHYCNWTLRYLAAMWQVLPEGGYVVINVDDTRDPKTQRFWYHSDMIRAVMRDIYTYIAALPHYQDREEDNPLYTSPWEWMEKLPSVLEGPPPMDCGEYIWSKSQVVAKKAARGSTDSPMRRPNHEYILFFRKGKAKEQASTMRDKDLNKMTISAWEDSEEPDEYEQELWGSFWKIAARPDPDHPAVFPPLLAYRMITFGGSVADVICDPFAGKGTSLYVAARTGRQYVGIEQNSDNARRAHEWGVDGQRRFQERNKKAPGHPSQGLSESNCEGASYLKPPTPAPELSSASCTPDEQRRKRARPSTVAS